MLILSKIKEKISAKSSASSFGATIWTNGMMNAYTTNGSFLRDDLKLGNIGH
jgi:hypothetical protein